jgi:hypothetical protein
MGVIQWYVTLATHIVTYEIGGQPYFGLDSKDAVDKIVSGYMLPKPPNCPDEVYAIMKSCWHTNPSQRISSEQILQKFNEIFKSIAPTLPETTETFYEEIDTTRKQEDTTNEQIYN